jgi:ABC-type multidrug transport system fused ATPase/permease subunit
MTEFRLLWQFLRPHRRLMLAVLASILVVTGCGMLTPWLLREIVQIVRTATDASAAAQGVGWVALGLLIAYGLRSVGLFLNMHLSHVVAWNACHDVRLALYRRLQRMPPAFYANRQTGELASRVMKDSDNLEPLVADSVYAFVVGALQTLGSAAILIALNPSLALPALAPLPLAAFLIIRLGRRVTPAFDQEAEQNGELSALVHDNISGMKEIQVFNRERHEYDRVHARSRTLAHTQIYARKLAAGITPVVEGATGLSIVLVVWLAVRPR